MNRPHGFTRIELLSILGALAVIGGVVLTMVLSVISHGRNHTRSHWAVCVVKLKQLVLAEQLFMNDHGDVPSWMLSTNQGGSREYRESRDVWRHFQLLSNDLNTPKLLHCPADKGRKATQNWATLRNQNVSYFVNLNALWNTNNEVNSTMMVFGDRLIQYQDAGSETRLLITTNRPVSWKPELDQQKGQIAFVDGSVVRFSTEELQDFIRAAGAKRAQTTNPPPLLALP